jgi:hypothetical protein
MDESFQLRAKRLLGKHAPAPLDFSLLSATLSAQAARPAEPLGEIVLGGPEWADAASAQGGCFNRAEVKRRRNEP